MTTHVGIWETMRELMHKMCRLQLFMKKWVQPGMLICLKPVIHFSFSYNIYTSLMIFFTIMPLISLFVPYIGGDTYISLSRTQLQWPNVNELMCVAMWAYF